MYLPTQSVCQSTYNGDSKGCNHRQHSFTSCDVHPIFDSHDEGHQPYPIKLRADALMPSTPGTPEMSSLSANLVASSTNPNGSIPPKDDVHVRDSFFKSVQW